MQIAGLRALPAAALAPPAAPPRCTLGLQKRLPLQRHGGCQLRAINGSGLIVLVEISFEDVLKGAAALLANEKVVLAASAAFTTLSLAINFWGGVATEKARAELALELEREKARQQQLLDIYDVTARYRGPLLEAAIDLEQALWHLITDPSWRLPQRSSSPSNGAASTGAATKESSSNGAGGGASGAAGLAGPGLESADSDLSYLLFNLAQFLGFLEVLRREGPRERSFLQVGNPHGSITILTLLEGIRFGMCASQDSLQRWYQQGPQRPHPGCRSRSSREEVIRECRASTSAPGTAAAAPAPGNCSSDALRVPRGTQRAIGTLMIATPMGAPRHYTTSYGDFHQRLEGDPAFRRWFRQLEEDVSGLATCPGWYGERPFPAWRWTRVLLLQQLLVELFDLLDPDCVRLPMSRRTRLMPLKWGPLPGLELYQQQLKALSQAFDLTQEDEQAPDAGGSSRLEGIRDLLRSFGGEELEGQLPEPQVQVQAAREQQPAVGVGSKASTK